MKNYNYTIPIYKALVLTKALKRTMHNACMRSLQTTAAEHPLYYPLYYMYTIHASETKFLNSICGDRG